MIGRTARGSSPRSPLAAPQAEPRWYPAARARLLATAALLALVAAVLTGHAALVLLGAPALGALALLPRRRPAEPTVAVTRSGSRCFEGEEVTVTFTINAASALDEEPDSYANVARTTFDALSSYAADVRSARQIKGGVRR